MAARRAGRFGVGFIAQTREPSLEDAYLDACVEVGNEPSLCLLPPEGMPPSVFVHDDLDAGWDEVGAALLADALPYHAWNADAGHTETTTSLSSATSIEDLRRAEGSHRVATVADAAGLIQRFGSLGLQPLCGGLDPDVAWPTFGESSRTWCPRSWRPAPDRRRTLRRAWGVISHTDRPSLRSQRQVGALIPR